MAKQLNINLGVTADTSQAQKQLKELNNSLNQIRSTPARLFDDTNLKNASKAAAELQKHLNAAVDINTGKLDLSRFSQSLNQSGKKLKDFQRTLSALGPQGDKAFLALSRSIASADAPMLRLNAKMQQFLTTLKNTARWQISSSILHAFMGTLQSAHGYAQKLDESLNNIRIVTGQSTDEMAHFAQEANKAAQALSTTTRSYTEAALIFYQQGLTEDLVKEYTDVTIKMANVTGDGAKEVSSYMTAIWNNFNKEGDQTAEHFGDILAKLGATTASSSAEIAAGLEKFASIADVTKLSYDYAAASLATLVANTRQSADVVGTSLKTIFSRLEGVKLGQTLEDGVELNKYSEALSKIGVQILDASGEMKALDTILDETAAKWDNLTSAQQMATAQTVAGVRQYNNFISLMDNWDDMQANLATAQGADGALQEQADIYADSWEGARDRVQAAAENIYDSLIDAEFFKSFDDGFATVLNGIANFIDGMGGMKGVLGTIGGFITQHLAKEAPAALERIQAAMSYISGKSLGLAKDMQNENIGILSDIVQNGGTTSDDSAYNAAIIGTAKIQEMKMNLVRVQSILSDSERAQYEAQIQEAEAINDIVEKEGERLNLLRQQNEEQKNNFIDKTVRNANAKQGNADGSSEYEDTAKYIQKTTMELQKLATAQGKFSSFTNKIKAQGQAWQRQAQDIATTGEAANKFKLKIKEVFEGELKNSLNDTDESVIKLRDLLSDLDNVSPEDLADAFAEVSNSTTALQTKFNGVIQGAGDFDSQILQIKQELVDLGAHEYEIDALVNSFREGGMSAEQFEAGLQAIADRTDEIPHHTVKMSEAFTSAAGAAMSLSGAINSIKSFGEIMSAEDATVGQQIAAVLAVITSCTAAYNAVKTAAVTISQLEIGAERTTIAKRIIKTAVTWKLVEAETAANAATLSLVVTMLALVTVIGLVVGGVILLVAAWKEWQASTPEGKLKAAKEEAKKLAEASEEATERANELRDAFDKYDSITEKLDSCIEGTQEWRDTMKELNDQVLELMKLDPNLSYTRDTKTGRLSIDQTSRDNALNEANKVRDVARYAVMGANIAVQKAQNNVSSKDLYNDLFAKSYSSHGNNDIASVQKVINNLDELNGLTEEEYRTKLLELGVNAELVDRYVKFQDEINELAESTQQAADNLTMLGQAVADNELGDEYDGAEKSIAGKAYTDAQKEIYEDIIELSHKNKQADKHGDTGEELMDRYWKAMGITGAGYASNMVRGSDSNRTYVYLDANGEEKEVSEGQMASAIAAYEALESLGQSAEEASQALTNMENKVNDADISDGLRDFISSHNFESMSKADFDRLKDASGDDLAAYLDNTFGDGKNGLSDEEAKKYGFDSAQAMIDAFSEGIESYDNALTSLGKDWMHTVKDAFDDLDTSELSLTQKKALGDIFEQTFEKTGDITALQDMAKAIPTDKLSDFSNVLSSMDFDNTSAEKFAQELKKAGIETNFTNDQLINLINAMSNVEVSVETIISKFAELSNIANDLEDGGSISADDYNKLDAKYQEYFQLMMDGTYQLTVSAKEFQEAIKSDAMSNLREQITQMQDKSNTFSNLDTSTITNSGLVNSDGVLGALGLKKEIGNADQIQSQIDLLRQMGDQIGVNEGMLTEWQTALDNSDASGLRDVDDYVNKLDLSEENLTAQQAELNQQVESAQIALGSTCTSFNELNNLVDEGIISNEAYNKAFDNVTRNMAKAANLDYDDVVDQAKALVKAYNLDEAAARTLAVQNQRMNRGVSKLVDNFETWKKGLKETDKTSMDYIDSVQGLTKCVAELVGASDDLKLPDEFFDSADNMALLEKAAKGDEDAINALGIAVANASVSMMELDNNIKTTATDLEGNPIDVNISTEQFETDKQTVMNGLQEMQNALQNIKVGDDVWKTLGGDNWVNALNEMAMATQMSVEDMNSLLNSMGVQAEVSTIWQPQKVQVPIYRVERTNYQEAEDGKGYSYEETSRQIGTQEMNGGIEVAQINTGSDIGKKPKITYTGNGSVSSSAKQGSKSGGGKGNKKTKEAKGDKIDETKPTQKILDALDDLSDDLELLNKQLDNISAAADRAVGPNRIKLMSQQQDLLKKQNKNLEDQVTQYKKLQKVQQDIVKSRKKDLKKSTFEAYGSDNKKIKNTYADDIKVDKNGNVNYTEVMNKAYNDYEKVKAWWNKLNAKQQDDEKNKNKLADAKAKYEAIKELLEKYQSAQEELEDTQKDIMDKENEIADKARQIADLALAKLDYELEIKVKIDDTELKQLKLEIEMLGSSAETVAERMSKLLAGNGNIYDKATSAKDHTKDLLMDAEGGLGLSEADANAYINGDAKVAEMVAEKLAALDEDDPQSAQVILDGLQADMEATQDALQDLEDQMHDAFSAMQDFLAQSMEDFDNLTKVVDHAKTMTQGYQDILNAVGKKNLDKDGSLTKFLNQSKIDQDANGYNVKKNKVATAQNEFDKIQAEYNAQKAAGFASETEAEEMKKLLQTAQDNLLTAQEEAQASLQTWIEDIGTAFEDTINQVIDDLGSAIAGAAGSLSVLREEMEQAKAIDEQYIDDYQKIYELSKLNRQVQKDINATDNAKAKKQLMEYQQKIAEYQKDGVEMSEYELEVLQKEYDLELAKIQMEEAKEAKSQVRMTKDAEGNYSYVYTADETNIENAEQNYEDKLYALQDLNTKYIRDLQDNIVSMEEEMASKIEEIMNDETLSIEEKEARVDDITAYYTERVHYYNQQLGIAIGNNKELYNNEWRAYSEKTGYKISADEDYIDSWEETTLAIKTGAKDQNSYFDSIVQGLSTAKNDCKSLLIQYKKDVDTALKESGSSWETYRKKVKEEVEQLTEQTDIAKNDSKELKTQYETDFEAMITAFQGFYDDYKRKVEQLKSLNNKLYDSYDKVLKKLKELTNAEAKRQKSQETTTPTSNEPTIPTNNTGTNSGNNNNNTNSGKPKWDNILKVYNLINTGKLGNGREYRADMAAQYGYDKQTYELAQEYLNYVYPTSLNGKGYSASKAKQLLGYDTGGYTGSWGSSDGKLALLHQKELVLNADDTQNMLSAINSIRDIAKIIDLNALSSMIGSMSAISFNGTSGSTLEQTVHITAEFPNATNKNEILEAFDNVINLASQYANRK